MCVCKRWSHIPVEHQPPVYVQQHVLNFLGRTGRCGFGVLVATLLVFSSHHVGWDLQLQPEALSCLSGLPAGAAQTVNLIWWEIEEAKRGLSGVGRKLNMKLQEIGCGTRRVLLGASCVTSAPQPQVGSVLLRNPALTKGGFEDLHMKIKLRGFLISSDVAQTTSAKMELVRTSQHPVTQHSDS